MNVIDLIPSKKIFAKSPSAAVLVLLCSLLIGSCLPLENKASKPLDILFPYRQAKKIDLNDFREPSGLVFHPGRGSLFVVGDEGDIAELQLDGRLIKSAKIEKKDFEGITCNPATGLLYAVTEDKARIVEVSPEDFSVRREFAIDPIFGERKILREDKNRVEAIAFVPDGDHPDGGVFYLSNKSSGPNSERESVIFAVEAPLRSSEKLTAQISSYFILSVPDLADLHYNPVTDSLYVISDETNTFFEITRTGVILRAYALPGENQEGITIDREGSFYIAQDSGGIIKFKPNQVDKQG